MSVFPLDPPGVDASGNETVIFVSALANPAAPTVAELKAGINLSCVIYGFAPSTDQGTVSRRKLCDRQDRESLGRPKVTLEPLEYDYDPQNTANAQYPHYAALTPGLSGWLIDRRGLDAKTTDVEAQQVVDVYPIQLGARGRVAVDPSAEGEKFRVRQTVAVSGAVLYDVKVAS